MSHVLNELEVSCLPGQLPEFITVDLANLEAGGSIHVSDLTLPEGVTALTHGQNLTVATAAIPAGAQSADDADCRRCRVIDADAAAPRERRLCTMKPVVTPVRRVFCFCAVAAFPR